MEKFIRKSESVIRFWFFKWGLYVIFIFLSAIVNPGFESISMASVGGLILTAIIFLIFLLHIVFEVYICYSAHNQSEISIDSIKSPEALEIFEQQRFFLKFIPMVALWIFISAFSGVVGGLISAINICFMLIFYRNHKILKFLFNL